MEPITIKTLAIFTGNTCVGVSFLIKVKGLRHFIKKKLQHRCFLVNVEHLFYRTSLVTASHYYSLPLYSLADRGFFSTQMILQFSIISIRSFHNILRRIYLKPWLKTSAKRKEYSENLNINKVLKNVHFQCKPI